MSSPHLITPLSACLLLQSHVVRDDLSSVEDTSHDGVGGGNS